MTGFCRREQSGFTLVELLVAVAILMIGLVAVMQWFPLGTAGVETGRRQSTGVFLAEQKLEQIKAWSLSTAAGQGFATVVQGGACCLPDAFNTIPGYPEYSRTVTIASPTLTTTLVRVQIQYRRVTAQGVLTSGQQVDIATLITQH
jgi:prepilin-type N-terminal cleavage/methylation domain-containing protein